MIRRFFEWFIHETGIHSLLTVRSRDVWLVLLSRFLRMTAFGMAALVLAIYLWLSWDKGTNVGSFLTMTLLGSGLVSYLVTLYADRIGRRRVIMIGSMMMVGAGIVFYLSTNYYLLLFAAIIGIIVPGAHEVGPFRALQEAILAQLSPFEARTDIYAWFAVSSTLGMAFGLCIAGWITHFGHEAVKAANPDKEWKELWRIPTPYPPVFIGYAVLGLIKVFVTFFLTERCEASYVPSQEEVSDNAEAQESAAPLLNGRTNSYSKPTGRISKLRRRFTDPVTAKVSPANRGILIRLCILFAINSFASGLLPVTLMSWYANYRYRWFLSSRLGYAMAAVWLMASVANLFSASIARRIGLVKAMVLVHLPNAFFLALIPLATKWWVMLSLLLVSSVLGSMDQAPRMAFVAAVFSPEERTSVMGTINLVRTVASAGGPILTGYFHDHKMWGATFWTSAALKILYDIGLLAMFLKTKLPEHGRDGQIRQVTVADLDPGILLSENFRHPDEFEEVIHEDDWPDDHRGPSVPSKAQYEHIEEA